MTVVFARKLPPGGGQRLRRAYLVLNVLFGILFVGLAGPGVAMRRTVRDGPALGPPYLIAALTAATFALLMVGAAATARSAVQDDTILVRRLAPAAGLATAGQLVALVGGAAAALVGAVLAVTANVLTFLFGFCAGLLVVSLTIPGGILRRMIIATANGTRTG
jgi:hypothetical protein